MLALSTIKKSLAIDVGQQRSLDKVNKIILCVRINMEINEEGVGRC